MRKLPLEEIISMKGNGASTRGVLKCFIEKGASIYLATEITGAIPERIFWVKYNNFIIPLRSYKLNFYCVYNSALAQSITSDKLKSQAALEAWNIPSPTTTLYTESTNLDQLLEQHKTVVVKPKRGTHGDGITINVSDPNNLHNAVSRAQTIFDEVLIQQQVSGEDYRLLFIDYRLVAAIRRRPAYIVGDGHGNIRQIVEQSNIQKQALWAHIRKGIQGADSTLGSTSKTPLDEIIAARGEAFLDKVPGKGEEVSLIDKANVSLGGQTIGVTDLISKDLSDSLSKMLRALDLRLCGIDVLSADISSPVSDNKSFVIELNSAPGLRLHASPMIGTPQPIYSMIVESLINHYS